MGEEESIAGGNPPQEDFLEQNDWQEIVADDGKASEPIDEDGDDGMDNDQDVLGTHETLEIDMSNNSCAYFDKHQDSIFTIFKHPKLPLVVTGGGDDTAYLWATHTSPPHFVGELQGHRELVIAGAFSADGAYVITGDMNGYIMVHRSTRGGEQWVKFAELEEVKEVLWIKSHPTLPCFAFGATDGSVWVYQIDTTSKSLVQVMSGFSHSLECNGGVFIENKDENEIVLVSISEDGTIVSWNCNTGEVKSRLSPHESFRGVESPWVSVSAYRSLVAVGGRDGQLVIFNNDTGKVVHTLKTLDNVEDEAELSIEALAWCSAPANNILAVGLVSGDVLLFDTLQWRLRKSIKVEDAITKLEFLQNSPFLIGSSMDGRIYKWDARTGEQVYAGVGHNMGVLDFVIAENGTKLVTAGDEGVSLVFKHEIE